MSSSNSHNDSFVTDKTAEPNLYFSAMDVCSWVRLSRLSVVDNASLWYFIDSRLLSTASYRTLDPWGNRNWSSNQATRKERMMMSLKRHRYFRTCLAVSCSTKYVAQVGITSLRFKEFITTSLQNITYSSCLTALLQWGMTSACEQMTLKLYLWRPRRRRGEGV